MKDHARPPNNQAVYQELHNCMRLGIVPDPGSLFPGYTMTWAELVKWKLDAEISYWAWVDAGKAKREAVQ